MYFNFKSNLCLVDDSKNSSEFDYNDEEGNDIEIISLDSSIQEEKR